MSVPSSPFSFPTTTLKMGDDECSHLQLHSHLKYSYEIHQGPDLRLRAVVWMGSAGPSFKLSSWENGLQVFHNYPLDYPCRFSKRCERVFLPLKLSEDSLQPVCSGPDPSEAGVKHRMCVRTAPALPDHGVMLQPAQQHSRIHLHPKEGIVLKDTSPIKFSTSAVR